MKKSNIILATIFVLGFTLHLSCSKEAWKNESIVDVTTLTIKTFDTFEWNTVKMDVTLEFAAKIWLAKEDGQFFYSELKEIGDVSQKELIAALLITEEFTRKEFQEIEANFELGELDDTSVETRGLFVYKWTGKTATKRNWWGKKYTVYLCHKHQYGTIKCNGMRYDKKVYERTSYDCN